MAGTERRHEGEIEREGGRIEATIESGRTRETNGRRRRRETIFEPRDRPWKSVMNRVVKTIFDYRLLSIELNLVEDYFRILYRGDLDTLFFGLPPLRCVQQALCWHVARGRGVCLEKGAGRGRRDKPSAHCRATGGRQYGQSRMKESVIVSFSSLPPSSSGGREGC